MCVAKKIKQCLCAVLFLVLQSRAGAQGCPVNIGFETGSFTKWQTLAGVVNGSSIKLDYTIQPVPGRHTLYKKSNVAANDPYGDFPVHSPISGYSVQLGNGSGGNGAEAFHYTFSIPADRKDFNLVYYYAVVLQNAGHLPQDQPKFTAKVFNVTTGTYIDCGSFEYVAALGLPGFQVSPKFDDVLFKDWTPVTINLSRYAGATIRLEFGTNDCSMTAHFGYAYIDVDEACFSPISGSVICPGATPLSLTAPKGFKDYKWFNADFSKILGTQDVLQLPATLADSVYAVELTPFKSQGCVDTVYGRISKSTVPIDLSVTQTAVEDCIDTGVDITKDLVTAGSSPGLAFTYYKDPALTVPIYSADSVIESGTYYIKATNTEGCSVAKPVTVKVKPSPVYKLAAPLKPVIKPAVLDLTKLISSNDNLSYWMDKAASIPVTNPAAIDKDGTYYIKITNMGGCAALSAVAVSFMNPPAALPNVFSPNGDGINDVWELPALKYYPDCVVEVFSRSGQSLFRSVGYAKPWEGKYEGKILPVGAYYYLIRLTPADVPIAGSVTIIR
jgi:gliding motility-associated-like protein